MSFGKGVLLKGLIGVFAAGSVGVVATVVATTSKTNTPNSQEILKKQVREINKEIKSVGLPEKCLFDETKDSWTDSTQCDISDYEFKKIKFHQKQWIEGTAEGMKLSINRLNNDYDSNYFNSKKNLKFTFTHFDKKIKIKRKAGGDIVLTPKTFPVFYYLSNNDNGELEKSWNYPGLLLNNTIEGGWANCFTLKEKKVCIINSTDEMGTINVMINGKIRKVRFYGAHEIKYDLEKVEYNQGFKYMIEEDILGRDAYIKEWEVRIPKGKYQVVYGGPKGWYLYWLGYELSLLLRG